MRTFRCLCDQVVFFDNTQCVSCGCELGFCPACGELHTLLGDEQSGYTCGNPACGEPVVKCHNYRVEGVCNRCVAVSDSSATENNFCDCCRFNAVIPDLSKGDNRAKWRRLESAKRRAFYHLDLLGLPRGDASDGFDPPLSFEFKETLAPDQPAEPGGYATTALLDEAEVVMTGHLNGTITINIHEADPVERERLRVHFGEPHRSLVGHFRHEMAHYYWDLLVRGEGEAGCIALFGDHRNPPYNHAIQRYYQDGPPANWRLNYTSAYASMHPWEDFAETFAAYLEMTAVIDTSYHMGIGGAAFSPEMGLDDRLSEYTRLGTALNEINRTMGLKDLLTRSFNGPVIDKLRYIHDLVAAAHARYGRPDLNGV